MYGKPDLPAAKPDPDANPDLDPGIYDDHKKPQERNIIAGQGIYTPDGLQDGDVVDEDGNLIQRDGEEIPLADDEQKANAPTEYSAFNIPSHLEASEEQIGEFADLARELGLTQRQAQALVNLESKRASAADEQRVDAIVAQSEAWHEAVAADPELGGENFETTAAAVSGLVRDFGDSDLVQLLRPGLGNHPALVRFCWRLSQALSGGETAEASDKGLYKDEG